MVCSKQPSLTQAKEYIYTIDFSMVIHKMVSQDGWREADALAVAELYRNFLFLNKKYATDGMLPPSEEVDEFWHYHILDTRKYVKDCENIFGYYFHHYPYLVMDHQLNFAQLYQAFSQTQVLHSKEFGKPIYAIRSWYSRFWHHLTCMKR